MNDLGGAANPNVVRFIESLVVDNEEAPRRQQKLAEVAIQLSADTKKPLNELEAKRSVAATLRSLVVGNTPSERRVRPDLERASAALKRIISLAQAAEQADELFVEGIPGDEDINPYLEASRRREHWKAQ